MHQSCLQPSVLPARMQGCLEFEDISSPSSSSAAYNNLPESARLRAAAAYAEGEPMRGGTVRAKLASFTHTIPDFII